MNKLNVVSLVIAFLLSANLSLAADESTKPANYLAIKGGIYSPSNKFDVTNIPGGSTFSHFDSKIGFAGEIAVGHYLAPFLAMEVGAGYFDSNGKAEAVAGPDAKLRVVPVTATAKVLIPLGFLEPYGEFGVGGYFNKLYRKGSLPNENTKATFGLHAGAGINFNVTRAFFLGLEGKYLWSENSWGSTDVGKLNGFITTADIGFRF